jgi:PadR family transcriptional regulator AphA
VERRPTLSLNEWAVLGLLVEHPRHGYDVATELRAGTPVGEVWRVDRPLVYRAMERLEALGLAEARRHETGPAGPPRTVYGPTRRGRAAMRRWLVEPVEHLRDVRSALLLKLALGRRIGADRAALLDAQRRALAPRLDALAAPPVDPDDLAALWRHHSAAAVDAFLQALEEDGTATPPSIGPLGGAAPPHAAPARRSRALRRT